MNSDKNHSMDYESSFSSLFPEKVEAFSFWKGRVALFAILKAMGIGTGDEVLTPAYTCFVVPNAICFTGAKPVYIDNMPEKYTIDPEQIEPGISARTKAIVVQHTYGIPGPIEKVLEIANKHNIPVIEDCAHALGTTIKGKPVGLWGKAAFFSSQWSKPYTTGLGGIAITADEDLQKNLEQVYRQMHNPPVLARGKLWIQFHAFSLLFTPQIYWQAQNLLHTLGKLGLFVGSSSDAEMEGEMPADHHWQMGGYQKRVGLKKLSNYWDNQGHRHLITQFYETNLGQSISRTTLQIDETTLLRYPVQVENKEEVLQKAKNKQVEIGSWFETPLHPIPLEKHAHFGYQIGQCPNAERQARETINLPLHTGITLQEADRVLDFVLKTAKLAQEGV
jgi:dTDP-4-amino-4,6-dideoxygalactose transaminase